MDFPKKSLCAYLTSRSSLYPDQAPGPGIFLCFFVIPRESLGNLPNPKLHVQPCGSDHIHKCVETELVDLAA